MTGETSEVASDATEIMRGFLSALGRLDAPAMRAAFDDDGVWELPFAPGGLQRVHRGREALDSFIDGIPAAFDWLEMRDIELDITTGGRVIAELTGAGQVTSSGRPYANRYIMTVDVTADGTIERLVEYYDPAGLVDAFGGPEALGALDGG